MRPLSLATALLVLSLSSSAQSRISASYVAHTDLVAVAGSASKRLPKSSSLVKGATLFASQPGVSAGLQVTFTHSDKSGTSIKLTEDVISGMPLGRATVGPHETLLRLASPAPIAARVIVTASSAASGVAASSAHAQSVDVGNNAQFEFGNSLGRTARSEFLATIDSQGLSIRTRTSGFALGYASQFQPARVQATLTIQVVPDAGCTLAFYGRSCGAQGPFLFGHTEFPDRLVFRLVQGAPNSPLWIIAGTQRTQVPIPGTSCLLQTDPVVAIPGLTSKNGEHVFKVTIPMQARQRFNVQEIVLRPVARRLIISSTNGLEVLCR
ncbi:MAG: hypothetical protein ACE5F1_11105 [Planctomycetota bacterium]